MMQSGIRGAAFALHPGIRPVTWHIRYACVCVAVIVERSGVPLSSDQWERFFFRLCKRIEREYRDRLWGGLFVLKPAATKQFASRRNHF